MFSQLSLFLQNIITFSSPRPVPFHPISSLYQVQRTMLELLNQMDGFSSNEKIKVRKLVLRCFLWISIVLSVPIPWVYHPADFYLFWSQYLYVFLFAHNIFLFLFFILFSSTTLSFPFFVSFFFFYSFLSTPIPISISSFIHIFIFIFIFIFLCIILVVF